MLALGGCCTGWHVEALEDLYRHIGLVILKLKGLSLCR
jgi:hypothetical protein